MLKGKNYSKSKNITPGPADYNIRPFDRTNQCVFP